MYFLISQPCCSVYPRTQDPISNPFGINLLTDISPTPSSQPNQRDPKNRALFDQITLFDKRGRRKRCVRRHRGKRQDQYVPKWVVRSGEKGNETGWGGVWGREQGASRDGSHQVDSFLWDGLKAEEQRRDGSRKQSFASG